MKNSIIVDTSALIAYFIQSEKKHQCINSYIKTHPKQEWIIVSTVFSEIMTWLRFLTPDMQFQLDPFSVSNATITP